MNKVIIHLNEEVKEYTTSQSIQEIVEEIEKYYPNCTYFKITNMDEKVKKLGR